jgi:hypothetical protein
VAGVGVLERDWHWLAGIVRGVQVGGSFLVEGSPVSLERSAGHEGLPPSQCGKLGGVSHRYAIAEWSMRKRSQLEVGSQACQH